MKKIKNKKIEEILRYDEERIEELKKIMNHDFPDIPKWFREYLDEELDNCDIQEVREWIENMVRDFNPEIQTNLKDMLRSWETPDSEEVAFKKMESILNDAGDAEYESRIDRKAGL